MEYRKFILFTAVILLGMIGPGNGAIAGEESAYSKDPRSCGNCHLIKPYVETWLNSDFLDHRHEKSGIGCSECHVLTAQETDRNVKNFQHKNFKSPLEEREYSNDLCFRCHGDYEEIIERTKDYAKKGLTRNPHKSHYGEVDCSLCHKAHRTSIDYCAQCHQPVTAAPGWKSP